MGPCIYCHRRGVADTAEGPLCSQCARDAAQEDAEARMSARYSGGDDPDLCLYPDACSCAECDALEKVMKTWAETP